MRFTTLTLAVLALVAFSGCGIFDQARDLTPNQTWAAASESYMAVTKALTILGNEDVFTYEQLVEVDKWRGKARKALDDWRNALLAGDTNGKLIAMKVFSAALDELIASQMEGEAK